MSVFSKFSDGITSLTNRLANRRNVHRNNVITASRVSNDELRAIYKIGVGSKIVRLKTGIALNDTLQFENTEDEYFYNSKLQQHVKNAAKFQLSFGRGLLVIHEPGADLSQPMKKISDWSGVKYHVFSGDMVYVQSVDLDLSSPQYLTPTRYSVRGFTIHPSRCIDFKYVEPPEYDAPEYFYGGISEFELIRNELVSDQIVQRAVPAILEKSSTVFYKINGFKQSMQDKHGEDVAVKYFERMEDLRSVYGAGVLDAEDSIESITQALSNLAESDMITLRRLSLVSGLPLSWLVGEAARGLNSTGEGERQVLKQTISSYQSDYLLNYINRLMRIHGRHEVEFKDGLLETDTDRIKMETETIKNALALWQMGEDYGEYLERHGVRKPDPWADLFEEEEPEMPGVNIAEVLGADDKQFSDDEFKRDKDGKFAKTGSSAGGGKEKKKYTEDDYSYDESDYHENTNAVYKASQIDPVHEVRNEEKLEKIKKSMEEDGYKGEPILMLNTGQNNQAITGSHRIAAAQSIDRDFPVPVYEIDEDILNFESDSGDTILDVIGRDDEDVAQFLEEYGDTDATSIMKAEIERNQ